MVQLLFALAYYFVIADHYPKLDTELSISSEEAIEMQKMNAIDATCSPNMSFPNAGLAFACSGPRAAHTFHSVGLMNYWLGCVLMTCFPCCTLFYTNVCTDLNVYLGGERQSCPMGCLCSFCCSCCLIAQDAQSLDFATRTKTGFLFIQHPE